MAVVELKGLEFCYGGFSLKDVTFSLDKGEVVGVLGANGSGKTTLLKCIYGILKAKNGCVFVEGTPLEEIKPEKRAKIMGYVPQSHSPPFPYRCIDVVVTGLAPDMGLFGAPGDNHYRKALEKMELLGISSLRDRPYTELSGGQLRLVLIARALVQEPKVLILDEPTAYLDFRNQVKVLGVIRKLSDEHGISSIVSLHDPNLVSIFFHKVVLMKDGKIKAFGEPSEVLREDLLEDIYGIDVKVFNLNGFSFVVPGV